MGLGSSLTRGLGTRRQPVAFSAAAPAPEGQAPAVSMALGDQSPALRAEAISYAYRGRSPVLHRVDLTAEAGRITVILGASGSGKTTLLKLFKGLLTPQHGRITILDQPLRAAGARGRLDQRVAYIPQQLGLVRSLSVLDNTITGALARIGTVRGLVKVFPRTELAAAYQTLERLGIGHKVHEQAYALSGGERQRVAIARALMQRPQLIVADEFISQLDPQTTYETMDIMREIAGQGVALVMTTHELEVVRRYADRVIVLRHGQKILDCAVGDAPIEQLGAMMK